MRQSYYSYDPIVKYYLTIGAYKLILQTPKEMARRDWNSRQADATPVLEVLFMATAILAQLSAAVDARFEAHRTTYIDEFTALAQEIQEAEGIGHIKALGPLLALLTISLHSLPPGIAGHFGKATMSQCRSS